MTGPLELYQGTEDSEQLRNALAGLVSVPIIYSYLAVEAWVNNRLYQVWSIRHEELPIPRRFLELLGDEEEFSQYKLNPRVAELKERAKTLCAILG